MKFSERIVRTGLFLMIGLSFYLSYLIWWSPATRDPSIVNDLETGVHNEQNYKEASEIFLPLRLARLNEDEIEETNNESLIKNVQAGIVNAGYSELRLKKHDSLAGFVEDAKIEQGLELSYAAAFPLSAYLDTFHLNMNIDDELKREESFLRVQIDFKHEKIRFLNREKLTILEAEITSGMNEFQHAVKNGSGEWIAMQRDTQLSPYQYFTTQPINLKMYSYISSTRPFTVFRDAFFTDAKNLRSNDSTSELNFFDNTGSMSIQQEARTVDFHGVMAIDDSFSIYSKSYQYIRELGTSYGSLRLFDQSKNQVDYRMFVEGYPVFSTNEDGKITVRFVDNGQENQKNVDIRASMNMFQVPIPSDIEISLPASHDITEKLYLYGMDSDELGMMLIGYSWRNVQDTGVVDLEPEWYIQYGDQWYSYQELLDKLQESEG